MAYSEVDKFASAVLAHRYPHVPNLGDITKVDWSKYNGKSVGLVCGGSPCQAFSAAGLRKSLNDPRGNLTLEFMRAVHDIKPKWVMWENVPGTFSAEGNPFGCFVAGLAGYDSAIAPAGGKWASSGFLVAKDEESYSLAWRVLDAQYFGVPQRRRRIFLVGHLGRGQWWKPCEVLLERAGESRDTAPGRKAREEVAADAGICFATIHPRAIGRLNGGPEGKDWREGETSYTLDTQHKSQAVANDQGIDDKVAYTLDRANGQAVSYMETVGALCARDHKGIGSQYVQEGKVLAFPSVMAHGQGGAEIREGQARCLTCNEAPILFEHHMQDSRVKGPLSVSPQLNAKAGTGGGNIPLVMEVQTQYGDKAGTLTARHDSSPCADRGANVVTTFGCCHQAGGDVRGINLLSERAHTLQAGQQQSVVQSIVLPINTMTVQGRPSDDINPRMGSGIGGIGDPCPTITKGHSHAVCFAQNQEGELRTSSIANTVTTSGNATARGTGKLLSSSVVRRLTPAECEKLQAFPVGWTQIPYRGKPAEQCPDGPRYKALGNSWAVCCARWIFERIAKVDAL